MSNRFATISTDKPANKKKSKKDEFAKKMAEGDAVPLLNQRVLVEGQKLKGFQTIEKTQNTRPKGKPRAKPTSTGADGSATTMTKPKPAPKRKGPVGADVVTDEQAKAEKKALQQQKKAVASQRVKVATGDAMTAAKAKANNAKLAKAKKAEVERGAEKPHHVQHVAGHNQAVDDAEEYAAGPHDEDLERLEKRASNRAKNAKKKAAHVDPHSVPAKPKPAPKSAGGSVHIAAAERQSATTHEHLADGSTIAMVKFCFVANGKTQALTGGKGLDETAKLVAESLKKTDTVKGGFYIVVEGKHFSDNNTVDEPWMVESYYKALISIIRDKKNTAVAYPFWPAVTNKKNVDQAEAQVKFTVVGGTALDVEHVDHGTSIPVSCKKAKISFKHFTKELVKHGALLVQLRTKVVEILATTSNEKKADVLGTKLESLVDELASVAASMLE